MNHFLFCSSSTLVDHISIPDPNFFFITDGSASKSFSILPKKLFLSSRIWSVLFIPDPDSDFLPIPDLGFMGSRRHRIPDPCPERQIFVAWSPLCCPVADCSQCGGCRVITSQVYEMRPTQQQQQLQAFIIIRDQFPFSFVQIIVSFVSLFQL